MSIKQLTLLGAIAGSLLATGCDLDVPDLNNPGLDQLQDTPTAIGITTAATGLLIGNRGGKSATTGLVNQLGILGRESYDIDVSENRFVAELMEGPLIKNSPFGGVFWANNYANIRLGNIILHGLDKVPVFSTAEDIEKDRSAIRGFVYTIQALEFMVVVLTHDSTGAPIDVDRPLDGPLAPFASKDAVYAEIVRLLDAGRDELVKAGDAFPFTLSPGHTGFNTPATFSKFNRAIRARIAVYQAGNTRAGGSANYQEALTALQGSFISDTGDPTMLNFQTGVYYTFTLTSGDVQNGLVNRSIYAHPKLLADVQNNGATPPVVDARYTAKINDLGSTMAASSSTDKAITSSLKFKLYPLNTSPLPLIRNEELILLKAEALYFTGDKTNALAELNIVHQGSGKLPALTTAVTASDDAFIDALLYERRYSLMFEGGHRWIDFRRFGRPIPTVSPLEVRNLHYPVPQAECDARQNEAACNIDSLTP